MSTRTTDSTISGQIKEPLPVSDKHTVTLPEGDVEFQNLLKTHNLDAGNLQQAIQQAEQQGIDWDEGLKNLNQQAGQGHPAPHNFPASDELNEPHDNNHTLTFKDRFKLFIKDIAYPTNHAIVCFFNDFLFAIPMGVFTSSILSRRRANKESQEPESFTQTMKTAYREEMDTRKAEWKEDGVKSLFAEFSFQKEDAPEEFKKRNEERVAQGKKPYRYYSRGTSWALGELMGDLLAIPLASFLKNFVTPVMTGIEKVCAPIARPFFEKSARKEVTARFKLFGFDTEAPEHKRAVDDTVKKEMKDLPMAVAWTVLSPVVNLGFQKWVLHTMDNMSDLFISKMIGSITTSLATVGLRTFSPQGAQKWDEKLSMKVNAAVSYTLGAIPGIDGKELKAEGVRAIKDEAMSDKEFAARYATTKRSEPAKPAASFSAREDERPLTGAVRSA